MSVNIPLLLFAKAPIAGKVKTRLMSHCSAQQAAAIAKLLIEASIQRVCDAWPGDIYLSSWLEQDHHFFQEMQKRYAIKITPQCEGDLGEKMRGALSSYGYPAAVMGCDAPHMTATSLSQAYEYLLNGEHVIGPSEDGGYYFLGLCDDADYLFQDMPWGTGFVLEQSLNCAQKNGLNFQPLEALNDVDEWGDLLSAAKKVPSLQVYLQAQNLG